VHPALGREWDLNTGPPELISADTGKNAMAEYYLAREE
jgi:hypothetical protein